MTDTVHSLTTSGLSPKKQIQCWSDALTDLCGQFDIDPLKASSLEARVNYTHQSKLYWGPDNVSFEPAYGLLDASVRLQSPSANWAVTLWGKNLTDELYSQLGLPFLGDLVEVWGPPRTYGVDFSYSF